MLMVFCSLSLNLSAQLNGEFEDWSNGGDYDEPDEWVSFNFFSYLGDSLSCFKTSKAYSGQYAALLRSFYSNLGADTIPSTLIQLTAINTRPNSVRFAYIHENSGSDSGDVSVEFYSGNTDSASNIVGYCYIPLAKNKSWQKVSEPITWVSLKNPDSVIITIMSAPNLSSKLTIDDFSFSIFGAAISSAHKGVARLWFSEGGELRCSGWPLKESNLLLYNLSGNLVFSGLASDLNSSCPNISPGAYIYRIQNGDNIASGKIVKTDSFK